MARWAHLFPSRTQKLSTAVAKVARVPSENSELLGFFFYGPLFAFKNAFWRISSLLEGIYSFCASIRVKRGYNEPMRWKYLGASKETDHPFLNFYTLQYEVEEDDGVRKIYPYFLASRNKGILDIRPAKGEYLRPDAVLIAAYRRDGNGLSFLLTKQFRPALNHEVYAFPAGLLDEEDEDAIEAARREAKEETGIELLHARLLVPPSPTSEGMSDECNSVVLAEIGEKGSVALEEFEDISSRLYTEEEVYRLLEDENVVFGNTARLMLLFLLQAYGKRKPL